MRNRKVKNHTFEAEPEHSEKGWVEVYVLTLPEKEKNEIE